MQFNELNNNQRRLTVNSIQTFDAWRDAMARHARYRGGMAWKTVKGKQYLYRILDRFGHARSLGAISPETEAMAGVILDEEFVATTDVDLLWDARARIRLAAMEGAADFSGLITLLRRADKSFEIVETTPFRAANRDGFMVDLIRQTRAPLRCSSYGCLPAMSASPSRSGATCIRPPRCLP